MPCHDRKVSRRESPELSLACSWDYFYWKYVFALQKGHRYAFSWCQAIDFRFRERPPFHDHACQQTFKTLKLVLTTWAEIYIRNVLKPNRIPSSVLWLTFKPLKAAVIIGSDSTFKAAGPASGRSTCAKLAETLRKITRKSELDFSELETKLDKWNRGSSQV